MEEEKMMNIIMAAISTLQPQQLTNLTQTLLSRTHHHHHILSSLLSSPTHFSLSLHHLHSLSLPHKSILIAKHLLSSLHLLTLPFHPPPPPSTSLPGHRDLRAATLLLFLCDLQHSHPQLLSTCSGSWRDALRGYCSDTILKLNDIGVLYGGVLLPYVEMMVRCWRFVGAMGGCGVVGKERRAVAAEAAAVVALPAVEVGGGGEKCVICREVMREGRDVCELPCKHLFHWMCILPWLKKRNTCPCCRFQLPTDDVFGEIERLWGFLMNIGRGAINGDHQS